MLPTVHNMSLRRRYWMSLNTSCYASKSTSNRTNYEFATIGIFFQSGIMLFYVLICHHIYHCGQSLKHAIKQCYSVQSLQKINVKFRTVLISYACMLWTCVLNLTSKTHVPRIMNIKPQYSMIKWQFLWHHKKGCSNING